MDGNRIKMGNVAFTAHMRNKAQLDRPECVHLGPDHAVFEFDTLPLLNQFVIDVEKFNKCYNYTISADRRGDGASPYRAVIMNPYTAEEEKKDGQKVAG